MAEDARFLGVRPERFRRRRLLRGLTQASLGRLAGVSRGHVWRIERARHRIEPETARKLARALAGYHGSASDSDDDDAVDRMMEELFEL